MNTDFFRFVRNLLIYTLIIILIYSISSHLLSSDYINYNTFFLIFFFFGLTIIIHYFLIKAIHKDFNKFYRYFTLTILVKLLIYLLIIVLYVLLGLPNRIAFIINFMILYILFTIYEVVSLNYYNKKITKKNENLK